MIGFKQFLGERTADPEALANRAASIYGKRSNYGKWLKAEKGKNIPLSSYDRRKADSADNALWKFHNKLGINHKDPETRAEGRRKYEAAHTHKTMNISDLKATQPFVRTEDPEKLKSKISDTNPSHIHVVKYRGIDYIADGHHAVMAAKLRGEKTVHVKHLDLDAQKSG